jgi:hypothetical protein
MDYGPNLSGLPGVGSALLTDYPNSPPGVWEKYLMLPGVENNISIRLGFIKKMILKYFIILS